jgi:hypothetical protein
MLSFFNRLSRSARIAGVFALMAAVVGVLAAPAHSRVNDRNDHLVWFGKRAMRRSEVPNRSSLLQPSANLIRSAGRFVTQGKTQVWVPNDRVQETVTEDTSRPAAQTTSKGRFVQQGKVQVWVEDK